MKSYIYSFIIALFSLTMISCKDSGSPESITELFIISYKNMDFLTMKNISTKNTKDLLKVFEYYAQDSVLAQEWQNKYDKIKIKITHKTIENDSTVFVSFSTDPDIFPLQELKLVKINEKLDKVSWKVDLSTYEILERQMAQQTDSIDIHTSHDGQIRVDADSIAVQE